MMVGHLYPFSAARIYLASTNQCVIEEILKFRTKDEEGKYPSNPHEKAVFPENLCPAKECCRNMGAKL